MNTTTATSLSRYSVTAADSVVAVRNLRCDYDRFTAVAGIDLTVRPGELFALLGTNGAGKTTTLETLEGFRRPTAGSVRVLGADPYDERRSLAARVGIMLQDSGFPDDLTTIEMLRLSIRLHPDRAPADAERVLETVGLSHRRDVRCRQLSGGERRRLDFAMAIAGDPEVLFLDEPSTGMDPQARERTWELIDDLRRRGTTILLTTHYLEEAEALADRVAIMHAGRIAIEGTLTEIRAAEPARIHAILPPGTDVSSLPVLSAPVQSSPHADGTAIQIASGDLQADLFALLAWADAASVRLQGLSAKEASLAELFHRIAAAPTTREENSQ